MDRKAALDILNTIEKNGAFSNLAVNEALKRNEGDIDSAFVTRLVYGVLENRIYLDYYISKFLRDPVEKVKKNSLNILRLALYQILYMDSVPDYAAVSEAVDLAKKTGTAQAPFVNGVLRSVLRDIESGSKRVKLPNPEKYPEKYLSVKYSFPRWLVKYMMDDYGFEFTENYLKTANEVPPLTVRVNRLKASPDEVCEKLREKGFEVSGGRRSENALIIKGTGLFQTEEFKDGLFSVQDESSMAAVESLNPQPGETVLDLCAAPGGKTLYAAEIMKNTGRVIACDIYENKTGLIKNAAEKNGLTIIETVTADASKYNPAFKEIADRVICDVPCSGLGVVRRKPEIKYTKTSQDIKDMCRLQFAILKNAARYVKPGGSLLYSTCTISRLENEGVIRHFLSKPENRCFKVVKMKQLTPFEDGTDGFFLCTMVKSD